MVALRGKKYNLWYFERSIFPNALHEDQNLSRRLKNGETINSLLKRIYSNTHFLSSSVMVVIFANHK